MTCKLCNFEEEGALPSFLCRACHPELGARAEHGASSSPRPATPIDATRYNRKRKRRLRAELREANTKLDLLRKAPGIGRAHLERAEESHRRIVAELALLD